MKCWNVLMVTASALAMPLVAAAQVSAPLPPPAPAKAPLSAEALWQLQRVGEPSLSPDGSRAVVSVTRYDVPNDRSFTALWIIPTNPGEAPRQLTGSDTNDLNPAWSPDGRFIAFVSKRTNDTANQIYVIAPDGGEALRVTAVPSGASAPKWFPDSQQIAFLSPIWPELKSWEEQGKRIRERGDTKMSARAWDRAPISYWDRWLDEREVHLFAAQLDGSEPRDITRDIGQSIEPRTPDNSDYDIASDGKRIAFVAETDKVGTRPNSDVFVYDLSRKVLYNATSNNDASDTQPKFSPDGNKLAWTANKIVGASDRDRLMVTNLRSRGIVIRDLSENWDWSVADYDWDTTSDGFWVTAEDRPTRRLFYLGLDRRPAKRITGDGDIGGVANAGDKIVALHSSFSHPATLVSVNTNTGSLTQLSRFNDRVLSMVDMGKVESVTYKTQNGADIQMWVVKPPNFDPARKYPLFLILHGGPHVGITDQWSYRWNAQVFSGWGYVSAWHNFHGSSGFGDAFTDSIQPDWATLPYQDTMAAANWFKAQPWIDETRMIAGGGSYGGYLASLILGRPHPFKALIAHAPVYNVYTQVGADYGAFMNRHDEHWENPRAFDAISPHTGAANFKTPTLVIHGQQDLRVPVNHGIELFNTLQKQNVPSRLVYYPNENHWILRPQNSINWYQEVRTWLQRYAEPGGK
jgi:dipeptidyl aminopeptidase/acylaminoacyl peptidase